MCTPYLPSLDRNVGCKSPSEGVGGGDGEAAHHARSLVCVARFWPWPRPGYLVSLLSYYYHGHGHGDGDHHDKMKPLAENSDTHTVENITREVAQLLWQAITDQRNGVSLMCLPCMESALSDSCRICAAALAHHSLGSCVSSLSIQRIELRDPVLFWCSLTRTPRREPACTSEAGGGWGHFCCRCEHRLQAPGVRVALAWPQPLFQNICLKVRGKKDSVLRGRL